MLFSADASHQLMLCYFSAEIWKSLLQCWCILLNSLNCFVSCINYVPISICF